MTDTVPRGSGGLAWIRYSDERIEAGPWYNLPKEYDEKVIAPVRRGFVGVEREYDPLDDVTNPEIRTQILDGRKRFQQILDRTERDLERLRQRAAQVH